MYNSGGGPGNPSDSCNLCGGPGDSCDSGDPVMTPAGIPATESYIQCILIASAPNQALKLHIYSMTFFICDRFFVRNRIKTRQRTKDASNTPAESALSLI